MADNANGFMPGRLVRWKHRDKALYGVVTEIEGSRIQVVWDEKNVAPPLYARDGAASQLEPVQLPQLVRRRSTGEPGVRLDEVIPGQPPRWKVLFPSRAAIVTRIVAEADLRPDDQLDPVGKVANGVLGTPKRFNLHLVARHYRLEHLHNDLVSLGDARVDVKPHQVGVVHRVITGYPHRFLLCDEVGLGKTIEAGMVLKELRARKTAQRVLIIVPPNLLRQWQFELKTKFNETFSILNTDTVRFLENQGTSGNPFTQFDSVLVSSSWVSGPRWAKLAALVDWDMVIVDEAHHARLRRNGRKTRSTQLYDVVKQLADPAHYASRAILFLTATPMQLDTTELYSLVELLDPALFPTETHFEVHRVEVHGLSRLVEGLRQHGFPVPGVNADVTVENVSYWLGIDEVLARKRLRAGPHEVAAVCRDLTAHHLLSEVLIRNRKAVVGGFMPRRASRWPVDLTPEERHALEAVEDYVEHGYDAASRLNDNAIGFVMVIFQKLMASSIRALREALARRREKVASKAAMSTLRSFDDVEDRLDDDAKAVTLVDDAQGFANELRELDRLIGLLDGVPRDSKADVFVAQLRVIFDEDPNAKVLVFTEFRDTQEYLAERIRANEWHAHLFHGQLSPLEKDRAVDEFREGAGPRVLLSTEAGGEGRNFQFCHLLVNYDLPWNPMRVEQRIGRVDRIGQDEIVQIFNLWVKGTIEERILDVLERRIDAFEQTVGGLDPILGDTEKDLRALLRKGRQDRERELTRLGERLEKQVADARAAEEQLRDFIMDTKSYSREIAERIAGHESPISPDDQERFIGQLLADVRTYIGPSRDGEHELIFHDPFRSEYPEFFVGGNHRRAVFRPDRRRDSEHVEYYAFGHPIVETILEQVLDPGYEGATGTRRVIAGADLAPNAGWLFAHVISVSGLRPVEKLVTVFVDDHGNASTEIGEALLHRAGRFDSETAIPVDEVDVASVRAAAQIAEGMVSLLAEELQDEARERSRSLVQNELDKLEAWFDQRERAARDRRASTAETLRRLESSTDEGQRRIIPVWVSNLERDQRLVDELAEERDRQLSRVRSQGEPTADVTLVAAGRVEIVATGGC